MTHTTRPHSDRVGCVRTPAVTSLTHTHQYTRLRGLWVERKRLVMDAVGQVAESSGKKVKQLLDEMGIETDEEAGMAVPPALA